MNEELRQKLNRHSCSSVIEYIEELEQEILTLRQRVEELEARQSEVAARAVEEIKAELLKSIKSIFHPHIEGVFAVVENRKLREQGDE